MSFIKRRGPILSPLDIGPASASATDRFLQFGQNPLRQAFNERSSGAASLCERRCSNPEALCSPILSTSSVWRFDGMSQRTELRSAEPITMSFPKSPSWTSKCSLDFIENFARRRRSCTALGSNSSNSLRAKVQWRGTLNPKNSIGSSAISRKVFVGGLCRDVDSNCLRTAFADYGVENVEWCDKSEKGFAYIIFSSEKNVRKLLNNCTKEYQNRFYFKIGTTRPNRDRKVQLIPWIVDDADITSSDIHMRYGSNALYARQRPQVTENTVFVGALHGEMTAHDLAVVMENLFGRVVSVGLDTDKYMYPVGTGRVTFLEKNSHDLAIDAEYILVDSNKFCKTLQVDPYLRDVSCSRCSQNAGPVFCRYPECFAYFCGRCFFEHIEPQGVFLPEPMIVGMASHVPLMRNRVRKQTASQGN